jgi:hypothetical protein
MGCLLAIAIVAALMGNLPLAIFVLILGIFINTDKRR